MIKLKYLSLRSQLTSIGLVSGALVALIIVIVIGVMPAVPANLNNPELTGGVGGLQKKFS